MALQHIQTLETWLQKAKVRKEFEMALQHIQFLQPWLEQAQAWEESDQFKAWKVEVIAGGAKERFQYSLRVYEGGLEQVFCVCMYVCMCV